MIDIFFKKGLYSLSLKALFIFAFILVFKGESKGYNPDTLKIEYPRDTLFFGSIEEGDPLKFFFTIKNNYEEEIRVNQIYSACGCTSTDADTFYLSSGESKQIQVSFNSKGRIGENNKLVRVFTNKGFFDVNFKVYVKPKEEENKTNLE